MIASMSFQGTLQTLNSINHCPPVRLGRDGMAVKLIRQHSMLQSVAEGSAFVLVGGEWVSAPEGMEHEEGQ